MLKKFSVKNYKNFKDEITVDFGAAAGYQFSTDCITDGLIAKMLIYGRNATGKTNLGKAIMDLSHIFSGWPHSYYKGDLLNADCVEDAAKFSYTFVFDGRELVYQYELFGNLTLKSENLMVDDVVVFECDFVNGKYNFDGLKYIQAETANTEIYKQSMEEKLSDRGVDNADFLPFLRWLMGNLAFENDSLLIQLNNYSRRMFMSSRAEYRVPERFTRYSAGLFYNSLKDPDKRRDLEEFLNLMGIECRLTWRKLPDGSGQLYFAHEKLVPFFENASSGTLALVELFRGIFYSRSEPTLWYLDEFDAFYHYEMADNMIAFIKSKYPECQVIMTTHNTNLMTNKLMRPDCMFILSRSGKLTALCDATERELREGHNLEKMYISGEFEKYE